MKIRHKRLMLYGAGVISATVGVLLILDVFKSNMMFFVSPSEFMAAPARHVHKEVRLGGYVKAGSIQKLDTHQIRFVVTDFEAEVPVTYRGLIPSLFREDKGAVVRGRWNPEAQVFQSREILAKHDENYTPPEMTQMHAKGAA